MISFLQLIKTQPIFEESNVQSYAQSQSSKLIAPLIKVVAGEIL